MSENYYLKCPKCGYYSGDNWFQCKNHCPIIVSPHYDKVTHKEYGDLIKLSQAEYDKQER